MVVTLIIIAITVLVSVMAFGNRELYRRLAFNAYDIRQFRNGYRFLSYAVVHADWVHLLVNMLVYYSFGRVVEMYYQMLWGVLPDALGHKGHLLLLAFICWRHRVFNNARICQT